MRPIAAAVDRLPCLTDLSLAHNRIGPSGASALASCLGRAACRLERLDLTACELDSAAVTALTVALTTARVDRPPLRVLLLAHNSIGRTGAHALGKLLFCLAVRGWPATPLIAGAHGSGGAGSDGDFGSSEGQGGGSLGSAPGRSPRARASSGTSRSASGGGSRLERLDVSYNRLGNTGLRALARAIYQLSEEADDDDAAPSLREVVLWPTLDPRRIEGKEPPLPSPLGEEAAATSSGPPCREPDWPLSRSTLAECRTAAISLWRHHQLARCAW